RPTGRFRPVPRPDQGAVIVRAQEDERVKDGVRVLIPPPVVVTAEEADHGLKHQRRGPQLPHDLLDGAEVAGQLRPPAAAVRPRRRPEGHFRQVRPRRRQAGNDGPRQRLFPRAVQHPAARAPPPAAVDPRAPGGVRNDPREEQRLADALVTLHEREVADGEPRAPEVLISERLYTSRRQLYTTDRFDFIRRS